MRGEIDDLEMRRVDALRDLPIWINDRPDLTVQAVEAQARQWVRENGVQVIVVDYLSLMELGDGMRQDREDLEVAYRINAMRRMARRLNVPVLVLAQFSRKYDRTSNRRPVPSDLRGSSAIENDAHVILLLHRPDYEDHELVVDTNLIIAKCREGEEGVIEMTFDKDHLRFSPGTKAKATPAPPVQDRRWS